MKISRLNFGSRLAGAFSGSSIQALERIRRWPIPGLSGNPRADTPPEAR
ncbi:hypothetical protein [Roseibium sp. Sym1]|nr:hypothetical protein [Roseibium sp. Sym1]